MAKSAALRENNPYHDPETGRFTDREHAGAGGGGDYLTGDNGEPMPLFHGSSSDFSSFAAVPGEGEWTDASGRDAGGAGGGDTRLGTFLTTDDRYAEDRYAGPRGVTYEVRVRRPRGGALVVDATDAETQDPDGLYDDVLDRDVWRRDGYEAALADLADTLKTQGKILVVKHPRGVRSIIVPDPTMIEIVDKWPGEKREGPLSDLQENNPYHDPDTGQFTDKAHAGAGGGGDPGIEDVRVRLQAVFRDVLDSGHIDLSPEQLGVIDDMLERLMPGNKKNYTPAKRAAMAASSASGPAHLVAELPKDVRAIVYRGTSERGVRQMTTGTYYPTEGQFGTAYYTSGWVHTALMYEQGKMLEIGLGKDFRLMPANRLDAIATALQANWYKYEHGPKLNRLVSLSTDKAFLAWAAGYDGVSAYGKRDSSNIMVVNRSKLYIRWPLGSIAEYSELASKRAQDSARRAAKKLPVRDPLQAFLEAGGARAALSRELAPWARTKAGRAAFERHGWGMFEGALSPDVEREADLPELWRAILSEIRGTRLQEYNHNHDERGRFATADGARTASPATVGSVADARNLLPSGGATDMPEGASWSVRRKYGSVEDARRATRAAIRGKGRERAYVIGHDGTVRYGSQGSMSAVTFGGPNDLHAAHIVHSHPEESALSSADVSALFVGKARSVEAITPSGWVFRLECDRVAAPDELNRVLQAVRQSWQDTSWGWRGAVRDGDLSPEAGAWYAGRHHVLKTLTEIGRAMRLTYIEIDPRGRERSFTHESAGSELERVWAIQRAMLLNQAAAPPEPWRVQEAWHGGEIVADDGADWEMFFGDRLREVDPGQPGWALGRPPTNRKNRPLPIRTNAVYGTPKQVAFEQAMRAAQAAIGTLDAADRMRIMQVFASYRAELVSALTALQTAPPALGGDQGSWQTFHLQQLIGAVDDVSRRFALRYRDAHMAGVLNSWKAGRITPGWMIEKAGVHLPAQALSTGQIEAAMRYSATLVTHVSAQVRRQIDANIFSSVMGKASPFDIVQRLAALLDPTPHIGTDDPRALRVGPGYARDPRVQADNVLRTEKGRVYSMATADELRHMAQFMPGLRKKWQHSGNPGPYARPYHRDVLHGQIKSLDADFNVNGHLGWGPHDAGLPVGEVARCGCRLVPWYAEWANYDTTDEREAIRQELVDDWMARFRSTT